MPYRQTVNSLGLSASDKHQLLLEFDKLRAELTDMRTKFGTLLAKLDADAGVTDTNYASTQALTAAQFNALT